MKILMLDKYLEVGGVATYLEILAKGLIERGHIIYLITAADDENTAIVEKFRNYGIEVITVRYAENRLVLAIRFLKHSLRLLKNREIDLFHSHHRLTHFVAVAAGKIKNIPRLLTLHVFKKDHKALTKCWKNECITVPSKTLKNHLINYNGLKEQNVEVIYNTIYHEYKTDRRILKSVKKSMFSEDDKSYVSYIGRISHEKGIDVLLEAIPSVQERNPEIAFRIIGPGPQLQELKERSEELNLETNKIFTGYHSNINEILQLTDICVLPSRSENFSLFVLECLRAAKPLIACNVGGIPEVITDNKSGLFIEPGNAKDLAEKILLLSQDKKLQNKLGEEGNKKFENSFSVKEFHKAYIRKYERLIGNN